MKNSVILTLMLAVILALTAFAQTPIMEIQKNENKDEKVEKNIDQSHKFFAVGLNNEVWELLGKEDRTYDDDQEMIRAAYASLYHWSKIGDPINIQRGEWLISHVWAILEQPGPAVYHAEQCFSLTRKLELDGFDLAYSCEALARAFACAGEKDKATKYFGNAKEAGNKIEKKEDAKLFMGDLKTGPWFGIIE